MRVLDVGSGGRPLFVGRDEVIHCDVARGEHLEVLCDAHHLPFRDEAFRIVHASHLLEHCDFPLTVLREFRRVCNGVVVVKVPNAEHREHKRTPDHIYSWNPLTFEAILKKVFPEVKVYPTIRVARRENLLTTFIIKVALSMLAALFHHNELTAICKSKT
ncbi:MAG: methyltransferase domain-containing protein [Candidatus Caldarchaeum sp.]